MHGVNEAHVYSLRLYDTRTRMSIIAGGMTQTKNNIFRARLLAQTTAVAVIPQAVLLV